MEKNYSTTNYPQSNRKDTFVIKIYGHKNQTWQGKIVWVEEKKEVRFRSALELIRLIDEITGSQAYLAQAISS